LTDLPDNLLHPSKGRRPPLFRYGYPVTRAILGEVATRKRAGLEFVDGMKTIQEQVKWYLCLEGILSEDFDTILEFRNSYDDKSDISVPPDIIEKVKALLGQQGPPKWYMDNEKYCWTRLY